MNYQLYLTSVPAHCLSFLQRYLASRSCCDNAGQGEDSQAQKQGPGFSLRVAADLGEFSLFVSGRPADTWWPDEVSTDI